MKSGPITGAQTRGQVAIILRQSVDVNQRCWQHRARLHKRLGPARDARRDRSLDEQNRTSLCQNTGKPDITTR